MGHIITEGYFHENFQSANKFRYLFGKDIFGLMRINKSTAMDRTELITAQWPLFQSYITSKDKRTFSPSLLASEFWAIFHIVWSSIVRCWCFWDGWLSNTSILSILVRSQKLLKEHVDCMALSVVQCACRFCHYYMLFSL